MSSPPSSLDLIQRAAEKLRAAEQNSTIERAAQKLREQAPAAVAPPAPVMGEPNRRSENPSSQAAAPGTPATDSQTWSGRSAQQSIDFNRLRLAGLVTPEADYTEIAEQYRIIKRPLLLKAFERIEDRPQNANVIMVTSARPGEGKTFTACNLALSIALEQDYSVLLIDADVRHPSVMAVMGLQAQRGLTDILLDPSLDPADVMIRASNLRNFALIPAGRHDPRTPELFASQRMGKLVDSLASRYPDRVIIIDTPPVLASSEPTVVALHVGQSVVVIEADRTSARAVQSALSLISRCPSINLVLNKTRVSLGSEEFGNYGYGYYYYSNRRVKAGDN
ncbi:MAG: AAA family ATPase [Alphaproteobacteria bacterium]|nr:AAA family ATPase [Alphaproteobacteria bacterium]